MSKPSVPFLVRHVTYKTHQDEVEERDPGELAPLSDSLERLEMRWPGPLVWCVPGKSVLLSFESPELVE